MAVLPSPTREPRPAAWPPGVWPAVSVVIPTRDRPELLARAVRAVVRQDYPGEIEMLVVFDRSEPYAVEEPVPPDGSRRLRTLRNGRTPGLAGARNTGILEATGEVLGHCDDDDEWLPSKLTEQIELWRGEPAAPVVASGLTISTAAGEHHRPAPPRARFADFLDSRIMEINPSNLLVRRADLVERIGLVDEELPNSFGEDYEWLLRASRLGDVVSVRHPLVRIGWNRPSFYMSKWQAMADGLSYILAKFPEFVGTPRGRARVEGQIAFACAAQARRRAALRWALATLRHDPRQLRGYAALVVAAGLADPAVLVRAVQARGRGL